MTFAKSLRLVLALTLVSGSFPASAEDKHDAGMIPNSEEAPSAVSAPEPAAVPSTGNSNSITLNFQDTDIQAVVKAMSQMTGRNFLLDQRVKGRVTVVSSKAVSRSAAYQIFLSVLKGQGLAAVEGPGGVTKIVPDNEAKFTAGVNVGNTANNSDQWVTQVIPIEHAAADQLSTLLKPMLDPNAIMFVYNPTNTLIVSAPASSIRNMLRIIQAIDRPGAQAGDQARVIYLKHAEASKLAEVLRGLLAGAGSAGSIPGRTAGGSSVVNSVIQADDASNSIIVSAPEGVYANVRSIIDQLDVPRAQVFVEALIAEVSTSRAAQFGVQWAGADTRSDGTAVAGALNFPLAGTPLTPTQALTAPNGITVGFLGESITLPDGTRVAELSAVARALESDTDTNILSTPNLLTLDNSEAKIVVGQNVPFLTGSYSLASGQSGSGVNPFQTIERKDVGLTLRIKPQISEGGAIKLQIFEEVSSVARSAAGAQDLITNKRSLETSVNVTDGNIIVLGGLIQDNVSEGINRVPILGYIPLIGWLFRYRTRNKEKLNLMIFLKPTIIRSPIDATSLTRDRYEGMRLEQKSKTMEFSPPLHRYAPPTMPEWNEKPVVVPPAQPLESPVPNPAVP